MNTTDKQTAMRLLSGLENGGLNAADAAFIADDLDPVLVYFIVRYLRECYLASDPAAEPVLDRVVAMTSAFPAVVTRCKAGEADSVSEWFDSEYSCAQFRNRGAELVELLVDKLES